MKVPEIYDALESEVRSYCRAFPVEFRSALGSTLVDVSGRQYTDLMSAAGSLNYGHNHPVLKAAVVDYLTTDGPLQSLDFHTEAKTKFLEALRDVVLIPRGLPHKVQFAGPTGSNSVEAALKIARTSTGRSTIAAFEGGFHGGSLGGLAVSSNRAKRAAAGIGLPGSVFLPYDSADGTVEERLERIERIVAGSATGVDKPAAFILETVQGEGGLGTASVQWLRGVAQIAQSNGILLIVDDVQAGCGRTGQFFSFEEAGIVPDIICLAKSIGGLGLPMGLVLMRPDLDVLAPGAHAGTFRGQNLSFVAGAAALQLWNDPVFLAGMEHVTSSLKAFTGLMSTFGGVAERGRGAIRGLRFDRVGLPKILVSAAFEAGLILETSGADSDVLKIMPPLTTPGDQLEAALYKLAAIIERNL